MQEKQGWREEATTKTKGHKIWKTDRSIYQLFVWNSKIRRMSANTQQTVWMDKLNVLIQKTHPNRFGIHSPQRKDRHSFHAENQHRRTQVHFHKVSGSLFRSHRPSIYHRTWSEDRIQRSQDTGSDQNWQLHAMTDWPRGLELMKRIEWEMHLRSLDDHRWFVDLLHHFCHQTEKMMAVVVVLRQAVFLMVVATHW